MSAALAPKPAGYARTQIILHWVIAALVLFQLFVHEPMEEAWTARTEGDTGGDPRLHILFGVMILVLVIWRLVLRLRHGAPPHPPGQPAVLGVLASLVHFAFYALLIILPVTGLVAWFGEVGTAARVHGLVRLAFLPLIGLHVLGALVQQFYFRSGVLTRMVTPER